MFKLIILISLGVSWIGLCIEGTGSVDDASLITKNVLVEPVDTSNEDSSGEETNRSKNGKNEPTLALLLTYHGNNCHKKQKTSTSKLGNIHITNSGSTKNVPKDNVIRKKLRESNEYTTSHSSSSDGGVSLQINPGKQALQHKYQELLDQLNNRGSNEKLECCGLNLSPYQNRDHTYLQLTEHIEPVPSSGKPVNDLESMIGSKEHRQHLKHYHRDHSYDRIYSNNDQSNPGSFSFSGESFDETSDEHSVSDVHNVVSIKRPRPANTPREQMAQKLIENPVKLGRPKFKSRPHTSQICQNQKSKPRFSPSGRMKLKSKYIPHHSHLKPLYIDTGSVYSESVEAGGTQLIDLYSDEKSSEPAMRIRNHDRNYKSGRYKTREKK